jgi:hypothetical protein
MPNGSVDPSTLEGDDLVRWYRRSPWEIDQERRAARQQRYNDFFDVDPSGSDDTEPSAQNAATPTPGLNLHSLLDLQSRGLSLDPSKPIWAPGAISASTPVFSRTSLLPVSAAKASQPLSSSGEQSGAADQRPSAGILGALFRWAVPTPGGRTLKSAMVTSPTNPQVGPDPSRVDVFQRGADGKLHPIPGWHTTGPFDFDAWSHMVDAKGAGQDLEHIGESVLDAEGANAAGEAFLDALGPGVRRAVERSIFGPGHGHHALPKFMGGTADQGLADMAPPMHSEFHDALRTELRKAGLPPVGGKTGSTEMWLDAFAKDPTKRDKAIEILKRVTHDFDVERGTSITPNLDRALGQVKPQSPPPPN